MPIYIKVDGVKGTTIARGANGGVWKTTNFITQDSSTRNGGPHVKVFSGSTGGTLLQVSQIALASGANPIDGRDPAAGSKVEELFNAARSQQAKIKVFICPSDSGTSASASPQGRLVVGTDQGVWRSGGASKSRVTNNLKQMPLPALSGGTVELIITDAGGRVIDSRLLRNATSSHHAGGVNAVLCDGSVR